jgi:hypothetical protein
MSKSIGYRFKARNPLAATCTRDGTDRFVSIIGTSKFHIDALAETNPKMYNTIGEAFITGFLATDDEVVRGIVNVMEDFCNVNCHISYIGKAKMHIYLPGVDAVYRLRDEMLGVKQLLQQPMTIDTGGGGQYVYVESPMTKKRVEDKNGRRRSVPVVNHCFDQIRPLAVRRLQEYRPDREILTDVWNSKRTIEMHWSY